MVDHFPVVCIALNECQFWVQLATCRDREDKTDPLWRLRRTLQSGADLLTDLQTAVLVSASAIEACSGEDLRGSALGSRDLTTLCPRNHVPRPLVETGGSKPALHPRI